MSNEPWQEQLRQTVAELQVENSSPRFAVVGVGSELRGDDAAGVMLARRLARWAPGPYLQVIEAGTAPENCCGQLRRSRPDLVLLVDAAQMDAEPGAVRCLTGWEVPIFSVSTHTLSLDFLAAYLASEFGCRVVLLGIQPSELTMGASLSPSVQEAVETIYHELTQLLLDDEGGAGS